VTDPKYAAFTALDPFFEISQQGLAGLVDGDHYPLSDLALVRLMSINATPTSCSLG